MGIFIFIYNGLCLVEDKKMLVIVGIFFGFCYVFVFYCVGVFGYGEGVLIWLVVIEYDELVGNGVGVEMLVECK